MVVGDEPISIVVPIDPRYPGLHVLTVGIDDPAAHVVSEVAIRILEAFLHPARGICLDQVDEILRDFLRSVGDRYRKGRQQNCIRPVQSGYLARIPGLQRIIPFRKERIQLAVGRADSIVIIRRGIGRRTRDRGNCRRDNRKTQAERFGIHTNLR